VICGIAIPVYIRHRDLLGGLIHEYAQVAQRYDQFGTPGMTRVPGPLQQSRTKNSTSFDCALRASCPDHPRTCRKINYSSRSTTTHDHAQGNCPGCRRSLPWRASSAPTGIDVACCGDDESVTLQRDDGWVRIAGLNHNLSTMATTGHIIRIKNKVNAELGS
jgi:hypothetical protein